MPRDDPDHGNWFLLVLATVLIALALWIAWPIKGAIVLALLVGYLLRPAFLWLVERVKKPWIASVLLVLLVLAAIVVPTTYLAFQLVQQAQDVATTLQEGRSLEQRAADTLRDLGLRNGTAERLVDRAVSQGATALEGLATGFIGVIGYLVIAVIVFFVLLYFVLMDGDKFAAFVRENLPLSDERSRRLLERTGENVKAIVFGVFVVALIQGGLAAVGWWLLGLPQPIFWGMVMVFAELIPFLASFVVLLPAAAWAFFQGKTFVAVGLLVLNFLVVGLVDNFIRPYLIGERAGVHPGAILVGIAGGVLAFGAAGLILGPLVYALVAPVIETWSHPADTPLATVDEDREQ